MAGAQSAVNPRADEDFCRAMLPLVSRTFAACIGLLPQPTRHRVLIAYLLCRIADTVEDTAELPAQRKRELLDHLRRCLEDGGPDAGPLTAIFADAATHDRLLTRETDRTLREFRAFPPAVRAAIRPWVQEMCEGMAGFAALQPQPGEFQALEGLADLDRYCWYVAGTVGHLLTDLFRLQSPSIAADPARYARLKALATDFGLGLQLVNIIKDVADDRQRGWSFVPRELCRAHGLAAERLLDPDQATAAAAVMRQLVAKARTHLDNSLAYCLELPETDYRLRLFCLAPLYFAVRTLALADRDPRLLDPTHKVKIRRPEVYRILAAGYLVAPCNRLVTSHFRHLTAGK